MKSSNHLWFIVLIIILGSCGNEQPPGVTSPLASSVMAKPFIIPKNETLCFLQVSGNRNQDTLRVRLNFHGDQVTGSMDHILFEKDARRGNLSGLLLQHDIQAYWIFMQEGIQDSLKVYFRLGDDEIWQRPLSGNELQKADSNNGYTIRIPLIDCGSY